MASGPITSWQIDGETVETVADVIFLGSKSTADGDCSHEIKTLIPWKESYDLPRQHIKKQRHYFAAHQASLSITTSRNLFKLMSIELVMPSNHLILCHSLLLQPSIFPSIRVFSNESVLCLRWPKYWNFSFKFSFSNEYSGLISFRMDWLDLLAVQRTLKSLLQHHSSKDQFFCAQISL